MFITLVAAMWLYEVQARPSQPGSKADFVLARVAFVSVLLVQAVFGLQTTWKDIWYPYSNGRPVADYIREHGWEKQPIIAMGDYADVAVTVVGYLGIDQAFYANGYRWGSFVVWDWQRLEKPQARRVFELIDGLGCNLTLLEPPGAHPKELLDREWREVARFTDAMVGDENYIIYRKSCN
jgi:hypothetical protein